MKYLLSFIVMFLFCSCGGRGGKKVSEFGRSVQECCASLSFAKSPSISSYSQSGGSNTLPVSVFELSGQLVRTW